MNKANGKTFPPPPAPPAGLAAQAPPLQAPPAAQAPGLQAPPAGQAPTLEQLIAEGHARGRRINIDQVYLGTLIDTLLQEVIGREKVIQELRAELAAKGKNET